MKIFLSKINESWVVDRFRNDWYSYNKDISTENIKEADIIWIVSPWLWKKLPKKHLKKKKVVCSIYHIDFSTFGSKDRADFYALDQFVDFYHVISDHTSKQLSQLTNKKIVSIPFWVDNKVFKKLDNKPELRKKYGFELTDYLIGSFQRDTEGIDLITPKLIKGPDIFFEIINKYFIKNSNAIVVLSGKRRNYLINKFEDNNVPYKYFEMVDITEINELYNILDLYIVSSRIEGGPQSIMECALNKTPVVSTDVGIAPQILHKNSIYNSIQEFENAIPNIDFAYNQALNYVLPIGLDSYKKMFIDLNEN